ncbi:MAG: hypothetical protein ACLQA5_25000 [Solirubrobacteraceae bacterium]
MAAYTSQPGAAGAATQGASTPLDQTTLDQSTLDQPVDHSLDHDRGEGAGTDQSGPEETPRAGYTANAQRIAARGGASGTISILA